MKLFISYARIDKPYCVQLVHTLDVHQVWFDQRLYAGQQWWKEILRRLDWSEGFIYLLSPESVQSEYCLKELEIAQQLQRPIIPVLIHPETQIPDEISDLHYVDITKGLTVENIKGLLNSLYLAEQQVQALRGDVPNMKSLQLEQQRPPVKNSAKVIGLAASALEDGQYDRAVFLLRQAKESGIKSRFINLENLLKEAELALEEQSHERDAKRDYEQIHQLFQFKRTRNIAIDAFQKYQQIYPDYDPHKLSNYLELEKATQPIQVLAPPHEREVLPLLKWCEIPGGVVTVEAQNYRNDIVRVEDFWIAQYPVTNEQFEIFVNDPDGYTNEQWWVHDDLALAWFTSHKEPLASHFKGGTRPRETVNWYEAIAFCNWLSHQANAAITLPTLAQWQRAALGDDEIHYPWGNDFSPAYCNTREAELKMTTPVTRYSKGRSTYNVYDLAGNVWEWALNRTDFTEDDYMVHKCAVIGGSFVSPCDRAQPSFRYFLKPEARYSSIGFRVVMLPPSTHLPPHLNNIS